jgi:glutamate racemase
MKIGFFDSGLGGLTILSAVRKVLPHYDYIYFGDTKNLPYGDKTEEEIHELTYRGIKKLFDEGALLVIVACNTASAESVRKHQDEMLKNDYPDRKLLGVIIPTVEALIASRGTSAILIGTERTVNSEKYEIEVKKSGGELTLYTRATPTLVPLIEAGEITRAYKVVQEVIDSITDYVDTLVLGCTHYTVLKELIRKHNDDLHVISQDEIIPHKLKDYLYRHSEIDERLTRGGNVTIELSSKTDAYLDIQKTILKNL